MISTRQEYWDFFSKIKSPFWEIKIHIAEEYPDRIGVTLTNRSFPEVTVKHTFIVETVTEGILIDSFMELLKEGNKVITNIFTLFDNKAYPNYPIMDRTDAN